MEELEEKTVSKKNWFDFDTVKACSEGAWLDIDFPDGESSDIKIKVVGKDSKKYKSRVQRYADKINKKKKGLSASETEQETLGLYKACILAWKGINSEEGVALEPTMENIDFVIDSCPWMVDQIADFVGDRTNFL